MSIAETEVPAEPVPPAWRLLLGYVRPHRWALLAGALLELVTEATGLLLPLVARGLIGGLSHDRPITKALLGMCELRAAMAMWSRTRRCCPVRCATTCCSATRRPTTPTWSGC
ncbi:hypothetical protein ACFYZE_18700 [Streptomyces sp. NPDC001796]|uniref:hypothetical protein n=1 Tax=Streptomyces sp. NPDC001796 TaxID=3364609 RepID=UPI00369E77D3